MGGRGGGGPEDTLNTQKLRDGVSWAQASGGGLPGPPSPGRRGACAGSQPWEGAPEGPGPPRPSASPGKLGQPPAVGPRVQRPLNRTRFHLCSWSPLRESGDKLQICSRENCLEKSENDILGAEGAEGWGSREQG